MTSVPETPVKPSPSTTIISPIKKSASAVETAVTSAANKLRRMSTNAIFSLSAHNSSNCKSNNKPSTSSAVSGSSSSNKCDIFNLLSRSSSTQQAPSIPPSDKGSNPSSPITSPTKLVTRSISNDPTASASGAPPMDHLRRDSLPIIGTLLSSFSSSSVSSSNSSSLSTSTFGTGSTHQGIPLLTGTAGPPKTSKLQALFPVSACYNGSFGRSANGGGGKKNGQRVIRTSSYGAGGDLDDDDDDGGGGDDIDDGDENHDDVVVAAATAVAFGSNGTRRSVGRKIGSTTSNSDSGRSSTEIGPEVDKDNERSQQNGRRPSAATAAVAGNGCVKDLV